MSQEDRIVNILARIIWLARITPATFEGGRLRKAYYMKLEKSFHEASEAGLTVGLIFRCLDYLNLLHRLPLDWEVKFPSVKPIALP